eukprot:8420005-Prorocentrum_lima.AAC.1
MSRAAEERFSRGSGAPTAEATSSTREAETEMPIDTEGESSGVTTAAPAPPADTATTTQQP